MGAAICRGQNALTPARNQMWWLDGAGIPCHDTARSLGYNLPVRLYHSMNDLNLDINLIGRKATVIGAEVLRDLTTSDLALLATERGIRPTSIQRITDRHHALARCLASGMSATEAGLVTGYTGSRISILRGDPSFEELISFYTSAKAETVRDYQEKAAIARNVATDLLIDKMEDEPEKFSPADCLDVAKTFADRTGHGPKATTVNVNVNLGDRMKAARERAALQPLLPARMGQVEFSHSAPLAPINQAEGLRRLDSVIDGQFTEVTK